MAKAKGAEKPRFLTVEQVAKELFVDPKTIYRLINCKKIKAFKVGRVFRVTWEDLEQFICDSKREVAHEEQKKSY
ncbi:MAG: helix-turn-helix domain-containing protein [Candidatus Pacebacteria bacterium]|nr:helix-turn-helix domain-containing protein [Candidatus Paceibacterota bacterium]